jgi:predicted RNase H-like HicB family nuclease
VDGWEGVYLSGDRAEKFRRMTTVTPVVLTREDGHWLADVPELQGAHAYARNLPSLDQAVREVIVLAARLLDSREVPRIAARRCAYGNRGLAVAPAGATATSRATLARPAALPETQVSKGGSKTIGNTSGRSIPSQFHKVFPA